MTIHIQNNHFVDFFFPRSNMALLSSNAAFNRRANAFVFVCYSLESCFLFPLHRTADDFFFHRINSIYEGLLKRYEGGVNC